ncbi:MAG: undecaprenyl/decaprenyl-phosphate alpha-N-acetylglucosaminyl 1-phosphate transferase [Cytophagales bacterium]|nr:MAG: undecaprenyl/decaprenyl-phosphate alpha-N-acetylglucosaminyl 1-phosphate transferase [Cytophagales bacterium]
MILKFQNNSTLNIMIILFLILTIAFVSTYISIPSIIKVAYQKHLCDEPDEERKIHKQGIPTLGGIAIFGGAIITSTFFVNFSSTPQFGYALSALILLFFTGVKDDIIPLSPSKKILAQLIAAGVIVFKCDIRLTNLYGLFYIDKIPYEISIVMSILTILLIVNAFNLVDGINGLSGGLGMISSLSFGILFLVLENENWAYIAFSLSGALLAFLCYNYGKEAKIFMGDTGSLTVGLFLAIFALQFIEMNRVANYFKPTFAPVYTVTILAILLGDALRLFTWRILQKRSPFSGDRNHFHHYLADGGLSHPQACWVLYTMNLFLIGIMLLFRNVEQVLSITFLLVIFGIFTYILWNFRHNKKQKDAIGNEIITLNNTSEKKNKQQNIAKA